MVLPFDAGQIVCPLLVGRDKELQVLERALDRAEVGAGQAVTLAGEAGIGKSRLVAETRAIATRRKWIVLEGRCFETDGSIPFAPILDLVRAAIAQ